ncbi:MAG: hypothetical protein ACYC9O_09730 [Candidatus Latescibacterota bacterium]
MQPVEEMEVRVAEVVDYLRINGDFTPALREVVSRKMAAAAARKAGIVISDDELQRAADVFRASRNLHKASDTESWMKSVGVTAESFESFLETSLLVSKFKEHLAGQADQQKYLALEAVEDTVRELVYQDWLQQQMQ